MSKNNQNQKGSDTTSTPNPDDNFGGLSGQAGHPDDRNDGNGFAAAVQRNLERNKEARASSNKWFALAANETALIEFTGEFGPVKKDFDNDGIPERVMYEYAMRDKRQKDPVVQYWDLSKSWAKEIDELLEKGHQLIEVTRRGAKKNDTKYTFTAKDKPVFEPTPAG